MYNKSMSTTFPNFYKNQLSKMKLEVVGLLFAALFIILIAIYVFSIHDSLLSQYNKINRSFTTPVNLNIGKVKSETTNSAVAATKDTGAVLSSQTQAKKISSATTMVTRTQIAQAGSNNTSISGSSPENSSSGTTTPAPDPSDNEDEDSSTSPRNRITCSVNVKSFLSTYCETNLNF